MNRIFRLMKRLRGKGGCPWDRKQNLKSLRHCILEEAHELIHAIDSGESERMQEEIGDMLCVLAMLMAIGEERGLFDKETVIRRTQKKMTSRHPHVFGNEKAASARQALSHFQKVKERERREEKKPLLWDLDQPFPALLWAQKLQRRVGRIGFDWPLKEGAFDKVEEELRELRREVRRGRRARVREELGDLLFAVVNLARKLEVESETALLDANKKFMKRFLQVDQYLRGRKPPFDLEEMDRIWERAKSKERR